MATQDVAEERDQSSLAQIVDRNIRALIERRRLEESRRGREERIAAGITRFSGSVQFVYIPVVVFGLWIVLNLGWMPLVPKLDPSFVALAMVASVEAIFFSTFVLIAQNR